MQKVFAIVKELVSIAPQMVLIPDRKGNYPIHLAIQNELSFDTISLLFGALPETRMILDVETKLLPFVQAAVGNWKSKKDQINTIHHLLREDPSLIFHM